MNESEYHSEQSRICRALAERYKADPAIWRSYVQLGELHLMTASLLGVESRLRASVHPFPERIAS